MCFQISRVKCLLPIPTLNYSDNLPEVGPSIPGLHILNSAHIVNGTSNVNETVAASRSPPRRDSRSNPPLALWFPNSSIMSSQKPIASLSLDLDNKWSYLKTHGDPCWESFPSYLDVLVPRVLEFLAQRNLSDHIFRRWSGCRTGKKPQRTESDRGRRA